MRGPKVSQHVVEMPISAQDDRGCLFPKFYRHGPSERIRVQQLLHHHHIANRTLSSLKRILANNKLAYKDIRYPLYQFVLFLYLRPSHCRTDIVQDRFQVCEWRCAEPRKPLALSASGLLANIPER
ncbi:hypothetical protein D3C71_1289750 [compost metagenome]